MASGGFRSQAHCTTSFGSEASWRRAREFWERRYGRGEDGGLWATLNEDPALLSAAQESVRRFFGFVGTVEDMLGSINRFRAACPLTLADLPPLSPRSPESALCCRLLVVQ